MRKPPANDSLSMSIWVRAQFDEHRPNDDDAGAMNRALTDLFSVQWSAREAEARSRRNASGRAGVFREWFTQWKGMIRAVNKYETTLTEPVTDATFPTLLAAAHPEWFLELYDARVLLTPMPPALLDRIATLRRAHRSTRQQKFDDPAAGLKSEVLTLMQADNVFRALMLDSLLRSISHR